MRAGPYYKNVYSNHLVSVLPYVGLYAHDTREEAIAEGRSCELSRPATKFLYTIKVTPK